MSSNYVTKDELQDALKAQTDELSGLIHSFMTQVDERFNKVEDDIVGMKEDIADIKQDIIDLKTSQDRLHNTLDAFLKRLTDNDDEQAARDSQFERLLAWARKVSEKTGIPLENL